MSNNTEVLASYEIAVLVPCLNEEPTITLGLIYRES